MMSKMHHTTLVARLLCVVLFFSPAILRAQGEEEVNAGIGVISIETGYARFSLSNLRSSLDYTVMGMSSSYNIRMRKLIDYPGNAFLGGSYSFLVTESVRLDLAGFSTSTKGAVGYRDLHGSLREETRLHIVYLRTGILYDLFTSRWIDGYAGVHVGMLTTTLTVDDKIEFTELSEFNTASSTSLQSDHFAGDLAAGVRAKYLGVEASLECGYRWNKKHYDGEFSDTFDGWTFTTRLGLPLNW